MADILVLGAGLAGLACAGALVRSGLDVVLLDKGRGVGGRCATRRIEGQPVDHGLGFLHGADPAFLAALDAVPADRIPGWPRVVVGEGNPCNPVAFDPASRRVAFVDGVNVFPKHLARGLDVRLATAVEGIERGGGVVTVTAADGTRHAAPTLVITAPVAQAAALLGPVEGLESACALLGSVYAHPCWTVLARYDGPDDPLDFELFHPVGGALQAIAHDSSKRPHPRVRTLVLHARPSFTARHLDDPPDRVVATLVAEAGALLGPWAARPAHTVAHRWRYARVAPGAGLAAPYLLTAPDGARIGIAGDALHPGGGAEGAYLSGLRLAARLLA